VDTSRERDQSIERLLRQSLQTPRHAGVTGSCLDAETLAAWVDGGLSGAALEMAQTHVADCARCQSMVGAMARTNAVVAQPEPERALRRWLPWLVPLTAAAAAVALWVAVPGDLSAPVAPERPAEVQTQAAETKAQQPVDNRAQAPFARRENQAAAPLADKKAESQPTVPELSKEVGRLEADALSRQDAPAAPAAAPPSAAAPGVAPPSTEAPAAAARSAITVTGARPTRSPNFDAIGTFGFDIVTPDPSVRWRVSGPVLEHSTNGGASWEAVPVGTTVQLTAGAAPSASVCWIVGRGGVVLLTVDGRNWRRVPFPESTDLWVVSAMDARVARVEAVDGRVFSTSDGGVTWERP
jgi:hypothetical protein